MYKIMLYGLKTKFIKALLSESETLMQLQYQKTEVYTSFASRMQSIIEIFYYP